MPIDYSDGKPLRYRLKDDGTFVLYSIGEPKPLEDESSLPIKTYAFDVTNPPQPARRPVPVDEGGDPTPYRTNQKFINIWIGRDVVWPQPATKEEIEAYEAKRRKEKSDEP